MDLGDMFNELDPNDDWDRWDYIEHLFSVWLDNDGYKYRVYSGSNAMIHFLREYYTPITIILNHKFKN